MGSEVYCAILNSRFESDGSVQNCPNSFLDSEGNYFCNEIHLIECPLVSHIEAILGYEQSKPKCTEENQSGPVKLTRGGEDFKVRSYNSHEDHGLHGQHPFKKGGDPPHPNKKH